MKFDGDYPPPSKPRKAKGGIKARAQRGAFGTQWWAMRWIGVLEGFNIGTRLQRGRSYARAGQVLEVKVASGVVHARVQGSRARPYTVTIRVAPLGKPTWAKITEHIASEARFSAKLLAGEMPQDIEEAFTAVGATLFPATLRELHTECSCPDWANPCKHLAATYYIVGEEFDRDPFLLFTLRGATKAQILAAVRGIASASLREEHTPSSETVPLSPQLDAFWNGVATSADVPPVPQNATKAPKRVIPAFPFWRGSETLEAVLARVDEAAAATALAFLAQIDHAKEDLP
jgi:uncharacterized Zn finger protein